MLSAPALKKHRVYIDAGHGAVHNEGATTALCEREQDVVLSIARDLAAHLTATGRFVVLLSRTASIGPAYTDRVAAAEKFRADALLSIHLDARGDHSEIGGCPRNDSEHGFAVLYSDRGATRLVEKRRALARSLAEAMSARELSAYDGHDYSALYDADPTPGVFIDRRGLWMLRRPAIPSVIIETHHGWALDERKKWDEEETRTRFAEAVAAALLPDGVPGARTNP